MSDFKKMTLKAAGVTLIDCVHKTPKAQDTGFPYIAIPQMKEGRINLEGVRFISRQDLESWTVKAKPEPFDVILSRRCNPGETAVVPQDLECALGQNLVLLRSDDSVIHIPFLRWLVKGPEWWHQVNTFINVGAVFDSLRCADIPKFELSIPPKESQIKITNILSSLDKKIETNQQINATLEAMAQALFKSWFVDFEPVKAKIAAKAAGADAEGMTLAAMEALSGQNAEALAKMAQTEPDRYAELKATAELFPDALVDSELGEIPVGWEVKSLGKIAKNIRKGIHPNDVPSDTPYVGLEHIDKKINFISRWGEAKDADSQKSSFKSNDVLFGKLRPYFHKVAKVSFDGICSTDILVLRALEDKYDGYLQHFVFQESFINYVNQRSTGTRMPRAKWQDMQEHKIVISGDNILRKFNSIIDSFNKKCSLNTSQSKQFEILRDTLLPRLLSGEVSVADV